MDSPMRIVIDASMTVQDLETGIIVDESNSRRDSGGLFMAMTGPVYVNAGVDLSPEANVAMMSGKLRITDPGGTIPFDGMLAIAVDPSDLTVETAEDNDFVKMFFAMAD